MRQRPWARLVVAVAGGAGLALSAPMLAAVGQVSPPAAVLTIGPTARLVAQGAAVAVPVRVVVTCPDGSTASVSVQVAQAVGRDVAHAFGDTSDILCNGTPQTVEVFATSQDFRFFPGPAFVTARLFCGGFPPFPGSGCTAQAQREVQIVGDFGPPPTFLPPTTFPPPPTTFPPPPPPPPTTIVPPPTSVPGLPLDFASFIANLLALLGSFGATI